MGRPFVLFEESHLGALAATAAVSLILIVTARIWASYWIAAAIRWILAGFLIAGWALWFVLLYNKGWFSAATILPMQLCDWAALVTIITLIRSNQRTYELAYFWALGGTLQALLTPDLAIDFPDPRFLIFFALHGGVIASVLFLTLGLKMRPWPSSIPRVILWSLAYLVAAIAVNGIFGTNFGYLAAKPAQPSLLVFLAPWPYYIAEMMLLGGGFIILLYTPFLIWDWRSRNGADEMYPTPQAWTFRTFLDDMARRGQAPALIAVRDGALHIVSFEDLAARTRALAGRLLQQGVKPGEATALLAPNGFEWVIARLALGAIGAMAVVIDELATDGEVQTILSGSGASRVLCKSSRAGALRKLNLAVSIIALDDAMVAAEAQRLPEVSDCAPAMLAYTSGTTGAPKAIALTHSNIETNVRALAGSRLVGPGDRVLLPLPLPHVYPFVVGLLAPLASGAAVVFPEAATGPQLLEAIRLAEVSAIVGVPRLYSAITSGLIARVQSSGLARRKLFQALLRLSVGLRRRYAINAGTFLFPTIRARFGAKLRLLVCGGAKLEAETLWTLLGLGFDVRSGYGLAETAAMFTGNLPGNTRWESEGRPISGDVRIASPDNSGIGEIELKGPQVFSHYLDNAEATRAAFTDDGWFKTGDLGRVDGDGFLFVTGRAKDILVLGGGKKADPEELEKLYGASRYIREIAIFEHKGGLAALVVPSLETVREGGAMHVDTAIRIDLASCARTLPSYQRLAGFAIQREPLPRTRLGKYRRFLLPAIYEKARSGAVREPAGEPSAEDKALLQQPVVRQVHDMLLKRYPHGYLSLDASPLLDLGIDSLEWISFGLELEDRLKLRLTEAEIGGVVTVRDLLVLAARAAAAPIPPPPVSRDWIAPTGLALKFLGAFLYALNKLLMRILFRLRAEGSEHLPRGNFILIANHASYLDAPAIAAALPYRALRKCYWAGDPVILFSKPWQAPFMRAVHCFPADERTPAQTLAVSEALLRRGDSIVWFPEGWRSPDGALQQFLPGIGHLLRRVPISVVPVCIDGTFEALPRDKSFPRFRRIRVMIGRPILPADWQAFDAPQAIADFLHRAIEDLRKP
jgi:long-chain acyl-CoA synthetase